jgi:hypothetical protein
MRNLRRIAEAETARVAAEEAFRTSTAATFAVGSSVMAFLSMMTRYEAGDPTPLPGMGDLVGQIGWAAGLGGSMFAMWWLTRGRVMKRLQGAVVFSLMVHLLMCVAIQELHVNVSLSDRVAAAAEEDLSLEELTLPDYGGMENPDAQAAEWEEVSDTPTPESLQEELARQQAELENPDAPQEVEVERDLEVASADAPTRQQTDAEAFGEATPTEIARQESDQPQADVPDAAATPEVQTSEAAQAEAEERQTELDRQANDPTKAEREQTELASANSPSFEAAQIEAQRNNDTPEQTSQEIDFGERSTAEARTVSPTAAENVEVTTEQAAQLAAQERAIEAAQRAQAELNAQRTTQDVQSAAAQQVTVTSVSPDRVAAADSNLPNTAPTSGGAAALSRDTSAASGTSAAQVAAQTVQVAAAGGVSSTELSENAAVSTATRGQNATVPTGSAANTGTAALGTSQAGVASVSRGQIGRQSNATGQARLGQAVQAGITANTTTTNGTQQAGAAGTQANEVAVASAGNAPQAASRVLTGGPSKTGVDRNASTSGLPARSTNGSRGTPGAGATSASNSGSPRVARSTGSSGLTARSTEPSARLSQNAGLSAGGSSGTGTTRSAAAMTALPAAAVAAEQGGALVMAGPRAARARPSGGAKSSLSGPRTGTVARRTAGLPGSTSRVTGPSRSRPGLPTGLAGGGLKSGRVTGAGRPKLASATEVAGMIRQSVPGVGASPEARVSAGFSMRRPSVRTEAVRRLGGSDASETAVERGLAWLANHQYADGHWSVHDLNCKDHECDGHGTFKSDTAATGLALLTFLGAGYTHKSGEHQDVVERGLRWLRVHQKASGDLFADESEFVWLYSHGMAAIALCEAYGMSRDEALKGPAQRSLDFIVEAQHPEFGGWRYRPQFESDTSVSGWQLMALKSGEMAGLTVPQRTYDLTSHWLDSVEKKGSPGRFKYHPTREVGLAMTAEGLLMRQYLGAGRTDSALIAGADYLRARLPKESQRDLYYWYYGTQVMYHMQGKHWDDWNAALRNTLVNSQQKTGPTSGSWEPVGSNPAKWGAAGGRHYTTCLSLLMLEVYYRHLPLYLELGGSK